jgi:hypothetical protein
MNLTNSSTVIDQGGPVGSLREALIGAWQLWEVLRRSTSAFVITIGHCPCAGGCGYGAELFASRHSNETIDIFRGAFIAGTTTRLDRVNADAIFARWFARNFTG